MKTLVFYGSPLKDSHTKKLLDAALSEIEGEIKIVDVYGLKIEACKDCRYCFNNKGCSIKDDMTDLYPYIDHCDNVIIASPMHFSVVSAPLMTLFSRLQPYWSNACIRHVKEDIPKEKRGLLLMTTGAEWMNMELLAEGVVNIAFHHLNAKSVGSVYAKSTEIRDVLDNKEALEKAVALAKKLKPL